LHLNGYDTTVRALRDFKGTARSGAHVLRLGPLFQALGNLRRTVCPGRRTDHDRGPAPCVGLHGAARSRTP
jgi:hypothetical protein